MSLFIILIDIYTNKDYHIIKCSLIVVCFFAHFLRRDLVWKLLIAHFFLVWLLVLLIFALFKYFFLLFSSIKFLGCISIKDIFILFQHSPSTVWECLSWLILKLQYQLLSMFIFLFEGYQKWCLLSSWAFIIFDFIFPQLYWLFSQYSKTKNSFFHQ